jgi:hypothetical protein
VTFNHKGVELCTTFDKVLDGSADARLKNSPDKVPEFKAKWLSGVQTHGPAA